MLKKIISAILVICMTVPLLASCGKGDENNEGAGTQAQSGSASIYDNLSEEDQAMAKKVDSYIDGLAAENDFNGKTFTWIGLGAAPEVEEETGDLVEDAQYYRIRHIEEAFGINFVNAEVPANEAGAVHSVTRLVTQDVMAGSGAYNAASGTTVYVCQPLFNQDLLADISDYTTLDLTQPWWTASLRDTYQIAGSTYFLTGPIVESYFVDSFCVMFNRDVADNYNVGDLYSLVKNNEWTFDKMFEISELVPSNENGTGAYRFNGVAGTVLMVACDIPITQFDAQGNPYVPTELSKELSDLADKFSSVFGNGAITAFTRENEDFTEKYGVDGAEDLFVDDNLLFYINCTSDAAGLRTKDVDFGILPMPKKDQDQENYISYIEPGGAIHVVVPKSTSDPKVTDVILESMAALGLRYLKPAVYDNLLKSRSTYDSGSQEMIDIVFASKRYDLINMLAKDLSYVKVLSDGIGLSSTGFASKYKMQGKITNNYIQAVLAERAKD